MPSLAIVVCGGLGSDMVSRTPTALHRIAGEPLFTYPLRAVLSVRDVDRVVVVGSRIELASENIEDYLPHQVEFIRHDETDGDSGIVEVISEILTSSSTEHVLIVEGDRPLITSVTLERLLRSHIDCPCGVSVAMMREETLSPSAVKVGADSLFDATHQGGVAGVFVADTTWLKSRLDRAHFQGIASRDIGEILDPALGPEDQCRAYVPDEEGLKVRNRIDLAYATAVVRQRINRSLMHDGVQLIDPERTYVDRGVSIGEDTIIHPGSIIERSSRIGRGCIVGPNAMIRDSIVGDRCLIEAAVIELSTIGHDSRIRAGIHVGPNSRVPPGSDLN